MTKGFKGSGVEQPAALHPDEIQRNLKTARLGKKIHYFSEIDSTNNYAYKLAQTGAAEGEVVIANGQMQGKGRLGRSWVSPPDVNVYLSVILRPKFAPVHAPQLTLMSGVALAETIQAFIPRAPEIKWPNDILVGGKKLAGILTEASCEDDRILFVVVGIGVNLNFPQELMPEAIKATATSILTLTNQPVDRLDFARRLIQGLDQCYGDLEERGFPAMASRWERFFSLRGKRVRVEGPGGSVLGKAVGIAGDGALILEDEKGVSQRVIAGDVFPMDT